MMWKRLLGFAGVLGLSLAFVPTDALGQKGAKKKNTAAEQATPDEYKHLDKVKELPGKVMQIDTNLKAVTIRVETYEYVANPNYRPPKGLMDNGTFRAKANHMNSLMQRQQQVMMSTQNPIHRQQQLAQINRDMANTYAQMQQIANSLAIKASNPDPKNRPYKIVTHSKDFELEIQDKLVVRKMFLGTEYDDTGNLKTYKKEEIAKLKGTDSSRPGYSAKVEDIVPGQEAMFYLSAGKAPSKKDSLKDTIKESSTGAKTDKTTNKTADMTNIVRPTVRMIVLTKELNPFATETNPKKK